MDAETFVAKTASPINEGENKKPEDVDSVIDQATPPTKKLKQARLPFRVLTPKPVTSPVSANSSQKKRKLSDPQASSCRQAKTPKNNSSEDRTVQTIDPSSLKNEEPTRKSHNDLATDLKSSGKLDCFVKLMGIPEISKARILLNCDSENVGEEVTVHELNNALPSDQLEESGDKVQLATEQVGEKNAHCVGVTISEVENIDVSGSVVTKLKIAASIGVENALKDQVISKSSPKSELLDAEKVHTTVEAVTECLKGSKCLDSSVISEADLTLETNSNNSQDEGEVTTDGADVSISSSLNSSTNSACDLSKEDGTAPCDGVSSPNVLSSSQVTPKSNRTDTPRIKNSAGSRKKDPVKQKERELARLERQKQREQAKAEKEQQRLEAKAIKEQERLEAKRKKEEERLRLQKEREEKLQQKEEERKKKQLEKEEEKRKKQELIDAKNEEKKKKDEERLRAEEELKMKKEKEKVLFTKFFTKTDKQPQTVKSDEEKSGPFIAFEVKDNMRLAPLVRVEESTRQEKAASLDAVISNQGKSVLYLDELKWKSYKPGQASKTWPLTHDLDMEIVPDNPTYHLRAKLLQFHENYRPAYYGTWRKCSRLINPRNPLRKDQGLFDYEVDSDEEWEEEEPGESLSHSEGEGSDDEKDDVVDDAGDDDDGFFVPHGYLSEGEGCEDEDDEEISPERLKARQLAKAKAWEADMKKKKLEVLKPVCIGCLWSDLGETLPRDPDWERLQQYTAVPLVSTPISFAVEPRDESLRTPRRKTKAREHHRLMPVPKEAIPDLIRLVHGNVYGIHKVVKEFCEYWHRKTLGAKSSSSIDDDTALDNASSKLTGGELPETVESDITGSQFSATEADTCGDSTKDQAGSGELLHSTKAKNKLVMSKRQLFAMIRVLAVYEKRPHIYKRYCWYVREEELQRYDLLELPVPTTWQWLTRFKVKNPLKPSSNGGDVASSENGQPTPTKRASVPSHNIKQFAVAGYTPPVQKLHSRAKRTPGSDVAEIPLQKVHQKTPVVGTPKLKRPKLLTPSALFSQSPRQLNTSNNCTPVKHDIQEAKSSDKAQRTLVSMFSPSQKVANKANSAVESPIWSKSDDGQSRITNRVYRPGDSAELPMEID